MNLETFIYNLHFDVNKINPVDWKVNWDDSPLPYKLYRGLPVFPLSSEVPLELTEQKGTAKADLREISHFFWYVCGLTQFCQSGFPMDSTGKAAGMMHLFRRFIPSGGALYPNELYVYLKLEDLPFGVYHYDIAHHRFVLLREGNFDSYLTEALGNRCDVSACFGTVFISTMFWKNFFKYNNFSYRLQGLDTGVLIGQLLEVAKRFGFESGVYFQFLDRALNHLIGLSEKEESVYAVIPLSGDSENTWFTNGNDKGKSITATELCWALPKVQHNYFIRSQKVGEYPMLIKMNEASMLEAMRTFQRPKEGKFVDSKVHVVFLPRVRALSYDLALACRKRHSPGKNFSLGKVSQQQLAALLEEATTSFSYRNDLDVNNSKHLASLYCCLYGVEGIPNGVYRYDSSAHALQKIRIGDYRFWIKQGMPLDNVNIFHNRVCLHVVGSQHHFMKELGYRGYRIQQMEAGMLVQRLLLVSSALGMGGHPILGFKARFCDELYKISSQGKTSLIQIPIGFYHPSSKLEGGLHG